jgi:hypothetical protein
MLAVVAAVQTQVLAAAVLVELAAVQVEMVVQARQILAVVVVVLLRVAQVVAVAQALLLCVILGHK